MRTINRLLAFVVGLTLAAAAAVAVAEMVAVLTDNDSLVVPRQRWAAAIAELSWDDSVLIGVAVVLVVVGLGLLVVEFIPTRPDQLALRSTTGATAAIDRRGLQERLRRVALRDDDVHAAKVGIRRRAKVRAFVLADADRRTCRQRIGAALRDAIDEIELARPLRVRVDVARVRKRVR